jgi:hypothetical protein
MMIMNKEFEIDLAHLSYCPEENKKSLENTSEQLICRPIVECRISAIDRHYSYSSIQLYCCNLHCNFPGTCIPTLDC